MKGFNAFEQACLLIAKCSLDPLMVDNALKALLSLESRGYREIRIPKKSGGVRIINAPCKEVKLIQAALLPFLYRFKTSHLMYGSQPKRCVTDNARFHMTAFDRDNPSKVFGYQIPRWVVSLDLKNAFPSVTAKLLEEMFRRMLNPQKLVGWHGLGKRQAHLVYEQFLDLLLQLTTHNGLMPQGAPTSPYLLNLALCHTGVLDRIERVCKERKYRPPFKFTVYVDDITVSSWRDRISDRTIHHLTEAIEEGGWFTVNREKTRRNSATYKAHVITGLVLTEAKRLVSPGHYIIEPKLTLPQKTQNRLRHEIHAAYMAVTCSEFSGFDYDDLSRVMGHIAWLKNVYRDYEMPSMVRQKVQAFEQAWSRYRGQKRLEYNSGQKRLEEFLQRLLIWREESS